ncbi:SIR2-like domain-containing protein [Desulfotomaculum arcticum]|uniref:SIR2-like domain-containing protein n=1 Tax=Desulfotruncus arcticus DSM 17038 TaxID=1121424 RepID=A0A1I2MMI9_9FIRM|nr:SIR2 family protein [Desulfotruncus arcticus]SFF92298.1 SIR2-like domain-containing protein [Desulfotomaculum arcticum] [Desulfotruncus arcticus DSM 17038]
MSSLDISLVTTAAVVPILSMGIEKILNNITDLNKDELEKLYQEIVKKTSNEQISKEQQIIKLIEAYKSGKLVLTLGAGIAKEHGLPDWNTLLQELFIDAIMSETKETKERSLVLSKLFTEFGMSNPLLSARYLRYHYQNNTKVIDNLSFEKAVKQVIYDKIKINVNSELFKEIRQLCIAAGNNPNLNSIITYNYDDVLEKFLSSLEIDIPFKSIYGNGINPSYGELPIYHVHGFLPQNGELSKITLSEDIYHQQYNDIYSWNNIVQINKFRDNICIFIGLSFTDPNLRRILDIARLQKGHSDDYHYLVKNHYNANKLKENIEKYLELNPSILNEKQKANLNLDETVNYLVNITEKFEEKDALSFGVQIIWVDDYAQIPIILRQIRKMDLNSK